jgi:hypothetical protein
LRKPSAGISRTWRFDQHPPWQASVNLNAPDGAAVHFVKALHQPDDFITQSEILRALLWPRFFVLIQLQNS